MNFLTIHDTTKCEWGVKVTYIKNTLSRLKYQRKKSEYQNKGIHTGEDVVMLAHKKSRNWTWTCGPKTGNFILQRVLTHSLSLVSVDWIDLRGWKSERVCQSWPPSLNVNPLNIKLLSFCKLGCRDIGSERDRTPQPIQ